MRILTEGRWRGLFAAILVAAVLLAMPTEALASPLFSLDTQSDWDDALNGIGGGTIGPVANSYPALDALYGTTYPGFEYVTTLPGLFAHDGSGVPADPGPAGPGMVMSWGDASQNVPQVGAWEYVYGQDPDLTGTLVNLTVLAPPPPPAPPIIQSVSLTLNSGVLGQPATQGWASWAWNVTAPTGPGPITQGVPYLISLDPTVMAGQSGSSTFAQSTVTATSALFDVTKVLSIQADELAAAPGPGGTAPAWVQFPSVPVTSGNQPWNYWSTLQVVNKQPPIPEPMTMLAVGMGIAGLGRYVRKRRKA